MSPHAPPLTIAMQLDALPALQHVQDHRYQKDWFLCAYTRASQDHYSFIHLSSSPVIGSSITKNSNHSDCP